MRIAVFGGTFDPPHQGHITLAKMVVEGYHADKVFFVPAPNPPHKLHKKISDFTHRYKMLELALNGADYFEISDIEQRRLPEPSFTVKTMRELTKAYPDDELFWLIGSDSLKNLHTWYKSHELVQNYNLMIYPRNGDDISFDELTEFWDQADSRKLYESILKLPFFDAASTDIRSAIRSGEDISHLVSPEVINYITGNNLYD